MIIDGGARGRAKAKGGGRVSVRRGGRRAPLAGVVHHVVAMSVPVSVPVSISVAGGLVVCTRGAVHHRGAKCMIHGGFLLSGAGF